MGSGHDLSRRCIQTCSYDWEVHVRSSKKQYIGYSNGNFSKSPCIYDL